MEEPTELVRLDSAQCWALLRARCLGRVVVIRQGLPMPTPAVVPINYVVDGTSLLVRTAASSVVRDAATRGRRAAFEVDDIDEETRSGWSVVVTGELTEVLDPEGKRRADELGLSPWAPGVRDRYLRFTVQSMSGRRVGAIRLRDAVPRPSSASFAKGAGARSG